MEGYEDKKLFPLTDAQAGIWFAQLRDPKNPIYKTGEYITIEGEVDVDLLALSIEYAINEVDSLHAKFISTVEGPRLYIEREDWSVHRELFASVDDAILYMKDRLRQVVDLDHGPLFEHSILTLGAQKVIWFMSLHHIAIDSYSMSLLIARVSEIYKQLRHGQAIPELQLVDQQALLTEDETYIASQRYQDDREFFLNRYRHCSDTVNLAGKPTVTSDHFHRLHSRLSAEQFEQMTKLAKEYRVHWYSVLIAAIGGYLHRMTRSKNVILGVPLMGRLGSVAIKTPAMRVNILPIKIEFNAGLSLKDIVQQVNVEFRHVRRHQGYRYEELHRELGLVQENRNLFGPLVNIMPFSHEYDFDGASAQVRNLSAGPVDDISIYCYESKGQLNIDFDANPALYTEVQLTQHQQRIFHFIGEFIAQGLQPSETKPEIQDVDLLLPGEADNVVYKNNLTDHPVPRITLTQLLAEQRSRTPTKVAAIFNGTKVTYSELGARVNQVSRWLIMKGVQTGDRIVVAIPRSLELIIAQQAILNCGAVYVPVDPDYPKQRIDYIIQSSEPSAVLSHSSVLEKLPETVDAIAMDSAYYTAQFNQQKTSQVAPQECNGVVTPDSIAYVIYTSGSTGKPKGVMIPHQAIVNRLLWMQHEYQLTDQDRVLQKTSAGFDVSVWEFFWPMMVGSTLVIAKPDGHKDPAYLAELIEQQQVTTLHFVPSMLQVFVQQASVGECGSLQRVFCSGEALPVDLVNAYYAKFDAALHNLYGPTEAAIDVTYWPCEANAQALSVPIGKPVWNTQILILDDYGKPVPPGAVGHLYIAGEQLATGYLGRDDLTAERFVANPYGGPGKRMYHSGDLARIRDDGAIEYFGRSDFQVKIRGFRIELEEIEHALSQQEGVEQVVVLAPEFSAGDRRLVAYFSANEQNRDTQKMQATLAESLPDYMVPALFVQLDVFPVTENGKLDRNALPKPSLEGLVSSNGPSTLVEERLCKLFCQLLGLPSVGVDDNFFELGGHSILAARLIAYVNDTMGIELSLATIFQSPTVAALAKQLTGEDKDNAFNVLLPLRKRHGKPGLFCVHPAGGLSWCYAALAPVIPSDIPLYGIQAKNLGDVQAPLPSNLMDMAAEYVAAIKAEQPFGPYHLMGWSIGGMIAHAMAAVLQQQGDEVGQLILLDAYPTEQWRTMNPSGEHKALGALIRMAGIEFDEENESELTREQASEVLQAAGSSLANLSKETLAAMIQVVINNNARVRDSVEYCYQGDMLFFNAVKTEAEAFMHYEGWAHYMDGRIEVVDVDCIHSEMMRPERLKIIGRYIARAIEPYRKLRVKKVSAVREQLVEA